MQRKCSAEDRSSFQYVGAPAVREDMHLPAGYPTTHRTRVLLCVSRVFGFLMAPNSFCAAPLPLSEPCVPASGRNEWAFANLGSQSAIEPGSGIQMNLEDRGCRIEELYDGRIREGCGRFSLDVWDMVRPGFSLSPLPVVLELLICPT